MPPRLGGVSFAGCVKGFQTRTRNSRVSAGAVEGGNVGNGLWYCDLSHTCHAGGRGFESRRSRHSFPGTIFREFPVGVRKKWLHGRALVLFPAVRWTYSLGRFRSRNGCFVFYFVAGSTEPPRGASEA